MASGFSPVAAKAAVQFRKRKSICEKFSIPPPNTVHCVSFAKSCKKRKVGNSGETFSASSWEGRVKKPVANISGKTRRLPGRGASFEIRERACSKVRCLPFLSGCIWMRYAVAIFLKVEILYFGQYAMLKRILPFFVLLLSAGVFAAPTQIIGTVLESETDHPLSSVSILYESGRSLGETDGRGRFELTADSRHAKLIFAATSVVILSTTGATRSHTSFAGTV